MGVKRVDLKIGFQCNNQCYFCVQGRKRQKTPSKDFELLKKNLQDSFEDDCREVVFTGGEPTLHPNFLELVAVAKEIGYSNIQIQTNGRSFFYKDFCKKTIEAGATDFSPSLHGYNAKIHDSLTRVEGSFFQTVKGILNLKELGQKVAINSVITSKNYKHIPKLAKLFVELGVDQFQFAFIHLGGEAFSNRDWIVPRKKDVSPYVKKGLEIGLKAGKVVMVEAFPPCLLEGYEQCSSELFIPEGKVFDIDFKVNDYGEYRRTQGKSKGPECPNCKFFKVCEGPWREYSDLFGWSEFKPVLK
jgi:MoaA/NifB/PqqE/SkfB family radical SAM enzyme